MRAGAVFLKLLLVSGLSLTVTAVISTEESFDCPASPVDTSSLSETIKPQHYLFTLTLQQHTYHCKSSIIIYINRPTVNISLYSNGPVIEEEDVTLLNHADLTSSKMERYRYCADSQLLVFTFNDTLLQPGLYTLNVTFTGKMESAFVKSHYQDAQGGTKSVLAMQLQPGMGRRVFPCWDEPNIRSIFTISLKHSARKTGLSNMPVLYQTEVENGDVWSHFRTSPTMPIYLLAIVLVEFPQISISHTPLIVWCGVGALPYVTHVYDVTEKTADYLTWYTKNPQGALYVQNVVIVPNYPVNANASWGITVYREETNIYNRYEDPAYHKFDMAVTVARQVAFQWFGGLVSPAAWSNLWLSEALAKLFSYYSLKVDDPQMMRLFVVQVQQPALHETSAVYKQPAICNDKHSSCGMADSQIIYNQASCILRMLQHVVTPKIFRSGIVDYLNTHMFDLVTPKDLWKSMENGFYEWDERIDGNYTVKGLMNNWLTQTDYPVVTLTRPERNVLKFTQDRFLKCNENCNNNHTWWIPITYTSQAELNFTNTKPILWLKKKSIRHLIDPSNKDPYKYIFSNDWIIVNLQQAGYYRVNYEVTNWRNIIRFLNYDNYTKIHAVNRAQLIDDAYHFVLKGILNRDIFFEITKYLKRETDYVPWYTMMQILTHMEDFLELPEAQLVREHMLNILDALLNNIGNYEQLIEDYFKKSLRWSARTWACKMGHSGCRQWAFNVSVEQQGYPTDKMPEWDKWEYCNGMAIANFTTWETMFTVYHRTKNVEILKYLACIDNHAIIMRYLEWILNNRKLMNDKILADIYRPLIKNFVKYKYSVIDFLWILQRKTFSDMSTHMLTVFIQNANSELQLEEIQNFISSFFEDNKKHLDYTQLRSEIDDRMQEIKKLKHSFNCLLEKNTDQSD